MKAPGEIFKRHIQSGEPSIPGWYLCYIIPLKRNCADTIPKTEIKAKLFKEKWVLPDHVVGWMGPLPVFSIDEIESYLDSESENEVYVIGTENGAKMGVWKAGPFYTLIDVVLESGDPGDFVFALNSHKSSPVPIERWSESLTKWVKIKIKPGLRAKAIAKQKQAKKTQEKAMLPYYIGTKKDAAFQTYKFGPFYDLYKAKNNSTGLSKGWIIWMIFEGNKPFPELIWTGQFWEIIDIEKIRKIEKTVQVLRKKYEKG